MSKTVSNLFASTGVWLAALAWAINMELGQLLPDMECRGQLRLSVIASFAGAALAVIAAIVSWRSAPRPDAEIGEPRETFTFIAMTSALSGLVFSFALGMQGIATLVLSGCER
jgi:hypothetical protein